MIIAESDCQAINSEVHRSDENDVLGQGDTYQNTTSRREKRRLLLILVILGCFFNLAVSSWIFFGLNVIYAEVVRIFSVSRSHASILFTVYYLVRTLHGLVNRELFQRFGLPVCLMAGAVITSLSFIGAAFTSGIAMFIAFMGVAASGTSLLVVGTVVAPQRFRLSKKKKSLVTVFNMGAFGIGDMTGSIIIEYLIQHLGYRSAMLVLAGAFAQLCVFNMAFWSLLHSEQSSPETSTNTTSWQQVRSLLKNGMYLVFLLGEFIKSLTLMTYRNTQVDSIITIGFSIQTGAFFAFLYGASSFVGRILNGVLLTVKKWHGAYHYSILNMSVGGCVLAAAFMTSYHEQFIINCILGAFAGSLLDFHVLFLQEIVSPEAYSMTVAVNNSAVSLAAMIMAPAAESWSTLFYLLPYICPPLTVLDTRQNWKLQRILLLGLANVWIYSHHSLGISCLAEFAEEEVLQSRTNRRATRIFVIMSASHAANVYTVIAKQYWKLSTMKGNCGDVRLHSKAQ